MTIVMLRVSLKEKDNLYKVKVEPMRIDKI